MIRSFEVRATKEELVCNLSRDLDRELIRLQGIGCKIISVISTPVKEYDYPKYFNSTLFTIIAEREDEKE